MNPKDGKQRPVLVAVDFSPHSVAALSWAARVARSFGSPLLVLHVVHDPEATPGYYSVSVDDGRLERREDAAKRFLADFLARARSSDGQLEGVNELDASVVVGLPATRILEVAERENAELIVMGSRGRTGLSHLLLGSKAERVVQLSPIPVTIVKADLPPWELQ